MESNRQLTRKKVLEILNAARENLTKPEQLAADLKVPVSVIYNTARFIRTGDAKNKPVGIHTVHGGYILSEFATVRHDVAFMRRLNGMRTGAYVMAKASAPHIKARWGTIENRNDYNLVMNPILGNGDILNKGMKVLTAKAKALGI